MKGWLLIDEKHEAARAYGCEMGGDVIVKPSGKIVGFTLFPDAQQNISAGNATMDGFRQDLTRPASKVFTISKFTGMILTLISLN
jgi:hypothetical protein